VCRTATKLQIILLLTCAIKETHVYYSAWLVVVFLSVIVFKERPRKKLLVFEYYFLDWRRFYDTIPCLLNFDDMLTFYGHVFTYTVLCLPGCLQAQSEFHVVGTNVYTRKSHLCPAAIHAGVISSKWLSWTIQVKADIKKLSKFLVCFHELDRSNAWWFKEITSKCCTRFKV